MADTTFVSRTTTIAVAWLQDINDAIYRFVQTGTGAVTRLLRSKLGELPFTPQDFGAVGDGVTDDTLAIQAADTAAAAAGRKVSFPDGTYLISAQLTQTCDWEGGYGAVILKGFNGDMVLISALCTLKGLRLDGAGDTYTGRGVLISAQSASGGDLTHWVKIIDAHILDMYSYCVEFTQNRAGYASELRGVHMTLDGANKWTTPCVKLPTGETNNGNRVMSDCFTFGHIMFDAGECDNFIVKGCQGAVPILGDASQKVSIGDCKIVSTGDGGITDWSISGISHAILNNIIHCASVTFEAGCAQLAFGPNALLSGLVITDNATGQTDGNEIDFRTVTYTPAWTGAGTPAIGDGTLNGAYVRRGEQCRVNIQVTMGSTTTYGSGAWSFSVPYTAARGSVGSVYMEDATGPSVYVGTAYIQNGASTLRIATADSSSAYAKFDTPFTWANGDKIRIEIEFPIV